MLMCRWRSWDSVAFGCHSRGFCSAPNRSTCVLRHWVVFIIDVASLKALIGPGNISANAGMPCMLTILHPLLPPQASLIDASTFVLRSQFCRLIPYDHSRVPDLNRPTHASSGSPLHPKDTPVYRQKAREASLRSCSQSELPETSALNSPTPTTHHSCGSEPQLFLLPPSTCGPHGVHLGSPEVPPYETIIYHRVIQSTLL